jgi:hypothetical protein
VDLLNSTKSFLPQVYSNGALQLLKAHIDKTCYHLGLVKLQGMLLRLVLFCLGQMITKLGGGGREGTVEEVSLHNGCTYNITQLSELHPPLVVEAELEGTLCNIGVNAQVD